MLQSHSRRRGRGGVDAIRRRQAAGATAMVYALLLMAAGGLHLAGAEPRQQAPQQRHSPQPRQHPQPAPLQHTRDAADQPMVLQPDGGGAEGQHLSSAQLRKAARRLAAADAAAWQALGAAAEASGGGSFLGGQGHGRALLQERTSVSAPGDEVVISSPNEHINSLTTQFFKVDFGRRTVQENPLQLFAINGTDR